MLLERNSIGSGMLVRDADGKRLGRVYAAGKDFFWIRPRFMKKPRWSVPISAVHSLQRGDVILRGGEDLLTEIDPEHKPAEPLLSVRGLSLEEQHSLAG